MLSHQVILASAGSGKTHRLTTNYLTLLHQGNPPQSILATTFSRKAAGEILSRILTRLARASTSAAHAQKLSLELNHTLSTADCQILLQRICESMHRLLICTIDSFFNRITQSFRMELGVPSGMQLLDENSAQARQLRLAAIDSMLGDEPPDILIDMLRRVHHDLAVRSVTQTLENIFDKLYNTFQQAPDQSHWNGVAMPRPMLDETQLAMAIAAVDELVEEIPTTKKGMPHKTWLKALTTSRQLLMQHDWKNFYKSKLAQGSLLDGPQTFSKEIITQPWIDRLRPLCHHAQAYFVDRVNQQTLAAFQLLQRFDRHYSKFKTSQRILFFSDLTRLLAGQLPQKSAEELTEIYFRLDGRFTQMMLDEFQDTSIDQWSVLRPFAQEITSYSDGSRNFFCVGDPKQAIYAWRGGCSDLLQEIRDDLNLEDQHYQSISKSYRSSQVVLDAVNLVFDSLGENPAFKKEYEIEQARQWRDQFQTHHAQKNLPGYVQVVLTPAAGENPAEFYDEEFGDDSDEESSENPQNQLHDECVAQHIEQLHLKAPNAQIGILVRTHSGASSLIHRLRKRGLRVSAEGGNPLTDDPAVNLILSACQLADHPGHKVAAFHVLNSPLAATIGLRSIEERDVAVTSLRIRRELLIHGYAATICQWAMQLTGSTDATSSFRLSQLIDLADRFESLSTLRPKSFVDFVASEKVDNPLSAPIRVMTIHASKGLEFDMVVLPQLANEFSKTMDVAVLREPLTGPIRKVFYGLNQQNFELDDEFNAAFSAEKQRGLNDELCGLYVAMTRARHGLYLFLEPGRRKKIGQAAAWSLSHAAILQQIFCPDATISEHEQTLYEAGDAHWHEKIPAMIHETKPAVLPRLLRVSIQPDESGPGRTWQEITPSKLAADGNISVADLLSPVESGGRSRGVLLHRWLAMIGWIDDETMPLPDDEQLLAAAAARREGMDSPLDDAQIQRELQHFKALLQKPKLRRELMKPVGETQRLPELWRERAFAVRVDGSLMRGQIDRAMVWYEDNRPARATFWDYKTDTLAAENAQSVVDHYRPQMEAYRQALAVMLNLPAEKIAGKLLLLASDGVVDV